MDVNPKQRRRHSAEFKAQVLAACAEPGGSVAAVARSFQLNDNLVHQWRHGLGASPAPLATVEDGCRVGTAVHLAVVASRGATLIRIDALWLCMKPVDVRSGAERLLAHAVHALGSANTHHGYMFANAQATRIKMLVHDGFGVVCGGRADEQQGTTPLTGAPRYRWGHRREKY